MSAMDKHTRIDKLWNPQGANTWAMIDCVVTSVVYTNEHGVTKKVTSSDEDSVIGLPLVNNPERAFAKLVDIDPDQQQSSTIYGMDLGVNWDPSKGEDQENAFIGDFTPAVITRDIWARQMRGLDDLHQPFASHSVSRLENIIWSKTHKSKALKKLSKDKHLSIMFSVFNYTRPPTEDMFTYGNIVGSIGIAEEGESLSFPGNRVMLPHKILDFPISDDNPCKGTIDWMYTTYFDVHDSRMTIDFSNSFKVDIEGNLCHFYPFYVGISMKAQVTIESQETITEVEIIDEIPYMEENWYQTTAGISEFTLPRNQEKSIENSKVMVVMLYDPSKNKALSKPKPNKGSVYPLCDRNPTSEFSNRVDVCAYIILEESPCLVRPMDYYVHRMEENDEFTIAFKARHYGQIPREKMKVSLIDSSQTKAKPKDLQYSPTVETDSNGTAHFHFTAGNVGEPRADMQIDGQVFKFGYCLEYCMDACSQCSESTNIGNLLVFLIWSSVEYKKPYFWDKDVQPIFQQYEHLYPVMRSILKMGDYDDVTKPANIRLLNLSMALDINHPSYMPVTRDLSPTKKNMILEWLNTPHHHRNWDDVEQKLFESPHFCNHTVFAVEEKKRVQKRKQVQHVNIMDNGQKIPEDKDGDTEDNKPSLANSDIAHKFRNIAMPPSTAHKRPAWIEGNKTCTVKRLKRDLQTAIELEFSTIPPYMTALYSIKDGYNRMVYDSIRSVVMQEMLHLAQAANLLISIGGEPRIDDPNIVPSYPGNLPGGVLPSLTVTLRKATPKHIADVFMMIEFPDEVIDEYAFHETAIDMNALTIGKFYDSIRDCMNWLHEKERITFGHMDKQLHWPWIMYDKSSNLYKIDSIKTARQAIKMIVEQGEGSKQMDPTYLNTERLAHFYKFEELACKRHLEASHEHSYSFDGEEIEFVSEGVWPMRDNPSSESIPKGSQVYYDAKIFHRMYRSLLRSIETMFKGQPDAIEDAVYIMESMQIQAKKLMQMEMPNTPEGHPKQTCGPVFDYEWKDETQ